MIYCTNISAAQREWLENYERHTGFEPMYQEDIDSGKVSFIDAARKNVTWYEDHTSDMLRQIDIPWQLDPDFNG